MARLRLALLAIGLFAVAGCSTANTGEAELIASRTPIRVWQACTVPFAIRHRIVTHDTPRGRDLYGKLTIRSRGGDPSVVLVARGQLTNILGMPFMFFRPYRLGTPIPVVEPGHFGGGVHTWHSGVEYFALRGRKPGNVDLEASTDPDPEIPEGDGVPTLRATFKVEVPRPTAVKIADAGWNDVSWKTVVFRDDGLRIKVDVAPPLADVAETTTWGTSTSRRTSSRRTSPSARREAPKTGRGDWPT